MQDVGRADSNPAEWIADLNPQVALLSVSAGDTVESLSDETLNALQGISLLRTDLNGWIHLSTDGERMWMEVEK